MLNLQPHRAFVTLLILLFSILLLSCHGPLTNPEDNNEPRDFEINGDWSGITNVGNPVTFTVRDDTVRDFRFKITKPDRTYIFEQYEKYGWGGTPIVDYYFQYGTSFTVNQFVVFSGEFVSSDSSEGGIGFDKTVEGWTAQKLATISEPE